MGKSHLEKRDVLIISGSGLLIFLTGVLGWLVAGKAVMVILPVLSVMLILTVLLGAYRRLAGLLFRIKDTLWEIDKKRTQEYRQLESLSSVFSVIKPDFPFPKTREWAASPDFLKKLTEIILMEKPELVVEASSGASSLVSAYCLKKLGAGKVISMEHEEKFASITRNYISGHGLTDWATIVHAPLTKCAFHGKEWLWYDMTGLKIDRPIDLLVIDGPPGHIQELSRYPAVPKLYRHLSDKAVIMLDDASREDEKRMVDMWVEEFDLVAEFLNNEKGACLLRKK